LIEQTALAKLYGKPSDPGSVLGSVYQGTNIVCARLDQALANPASDETGGPGYEDSLVVPVHDGTPELDASSDQGSGIRLR
jgi:hypothetical protein